MWSCRRETQMTAKRFCMAIALLFGLVSGAVAADTGDTTKAIKEARDTIAAFKKADPGLSKFFKAAVGYAVFPTVTKGQSGSGGPAVPGCSSRRADRPAR